MFIIVTGSCMTHIYSHSISQDFTRMKEGLVEITQLVSLQNWGGTESQGWTGPASLLTPDTVFLNGWVAESAMYNSVNTEHMLIPFYVWSPWGYLQIVESLHKLCLLLIKSLFLQAKHSRYSLKITFNLIFICYFATMSAMVVWKGMVPIDSCVLMLDP